MPLQRPELWGCGEKKSRGKKKRRNFRRSAMISTAAEVCNTSSCMSHAVWKAARRNACSRRRKRIASEKKNSDIRLRFRFASGRGTSRAFPISVRISFTCEMIRRAFGIGIPLNRGQACTTSSSLKLGPMPLKTPRSGRLSTLFLLACHSFARVSCV